LYGHQSRLCALASSLCSLLVAPLCTISPFAPLPPDCTATCPPLARHLPGLPVPTRTSVAQCTRHLHPEPCPTDATTHATSLPNRAPPLPPPLPTPSPAPLASSAATCHHSRLAGTLAIATSSFCADGERLTCVRVANVRVANVRVANVRVANVRDVRNGVEPLDAAPPLAPPLMSHAAPRSTRHPSCAPRRDRGHSIALARRPSRRGCGA